MGLYYWQCNYFFQLQKNSGKLLYKKTWNEIWFFMYGIDTFKAEDVPGFKIIWQILRVFNKKRKQTWFWYLSSMCVKIFSKSSKYYDFEIMRVQIWKMGKRNPRWRRILNKSNVAGYATLNERHVSQDNQRFARLCSHQNLIYKLYTSSFF